MPQYRRARQKGGQYFFTVVAGNRRPFLVLETVRKTLRHAIYQTQEQHTFRIDAWVLLPDHMHCIWTLPEGDNAYGKRWANIKRLVSKNITEIDPVPIPSLSQKNRRESGLWQRRFWEHLIRDTNDFQRHLDYIHFNPVKHGLVNSVADWPYSTFHRYVAKGTYPAEWGRNISTDKGGFGE